MPSQEEQWILDEKYNGEKTEDFFTDCERVQNGEPLAFIIGSIPFLSSEIFLDSKPLIPRVETEFWVEKAIEEIKNSHTPSPRILDLCAGSGCIGVAVLKAIPNARVDFVEIDTAHQPTILKNVIANGIATERIKILSGSLFENVTQKYDFILTNPPYIDKEADTVAKSVTEFEPHIALFGGTKGMELIAKIIENAPKYVTPQGVLYIEHDPSQEEALQELAHTTKLHCVTHSDQYNVPRYTVLRMAQ